MDSGTIYADGSLSLDGCVPMKWRCLALTDRLLVYHSPGGTWYDNGGRNYGPATIEVREIEELRPGNTEGSWRFRLKRIGAGASFHPTPREACRKIANELQRRAPNIATRIDRRTSGEDK